MLFDVKIHKLPGNDDLPMPKQMTEGASGYDLVAAVTEEISLKPGEWKLIPTGIAIEMPRGLEAQVRPRSGLALKNGITLLNSPGTIDADYRGEISVILHNLGVDSFLLRRGERIAQMVFQQIATVRFHSVQELGQTNRGGDGFGHTGK